MDHDGAMVVFLLGIINVAAARAGASDPAAVAQATKAADAWMKLVDDGDYKQS